MSEFDRMMDYTAESAMQLVRNHIAHHERQIAEATKHGEQMSFDL
ncbi:MAG TPA: hypothetical protein VF989_20070 [Polyangiaceae bacterium]